MPAKIPANVSSGLLEKHTRSGVLQFTYNNQEIHWSRNLFNIFDQSMTDFPPIAEWEIPCFSQHTQQLIKRRIDISEKSFESFEIRLPFKSTTGGERWVRFYCEFITDDDTLIERLSLFQDITATVNLAEDNNYYKERVELALLSSNTGTWDYHVAKNELFWDESMFNLFEVHRPNKPLKFSDWMNYIHPESKDSFIDHFNQALKYQEPDALLSFVFKTLTPLGNVKHIKISAKFYTDSSDMPSRVLGTCMDVTENEIATAKIIEQATIAQENAILAQDANESRARFIANVSHEIRTPMNSIMGTLQILNSYDFNSDLKELLSMASDSANELLQVINDVLDLSKIDAQKMEIEQIDINIAQLINNTYLKFNAMTPAGVSLRKDFPSDINLLRMGDPVRLNQILNNFLSNAIKFTQQGEICIKVSGDDDSICVAVSDSGIGIANDKLQTIFEPFKQADDTTTRRFGGTGLGLAISKKLAELMGGTIDISSKVGEGSTFTLNVPMPITSKNTSPTAQIRLSDNIPNLAHHKILYAEDNKASINIVKQLLRPTKAIVEIAEDGKQALDMYRKNDQISALILDIQMPQMNGMEVCERVRMENKHIPIIALTANVMIEDQKKYFNMGFSHIIEKPIKFDRFYETLHKI